MNIKNGITRFFLIGTFCGVLSVPAQADEAPDWLGGKLEKPLSETRIGMTVLYPGSNAYQAKYAEAAENYAEELGVKLTVMDPKGDPSAQFNQIQGMISQNLDSIVVWPTSENALIPAIRGASRAGIPVITSNSPIGEAGQKYIEAHTGPDDCRQAQQAAEMLGETLDGEGNIVVVEGTPGYTVSTLRKNCFTDKMEDSYPEIEILASQNAEWNREKAQSVMETYLSKFGDKIDGVYAFDDGMGMGVINALKAAGKEPGEVKVVTCNLFGEGWDAIKAGWETGSNQQSPIDDAVLAVQTAVKVANGIDVPDLILIETPKITAENVDQFERPTW